VGRESDVERLTNYLASQTGSLSVIGEHRIGKSSLIYEVLERVKGVARPAGFVWIDLSVLSDTVQAFNGILDGITENLAAQELELPSHIKPVLATSPMDPYSAYQHCRRGLINLRKARLNSLLVLDEFDAVRRFNESSVFIQRLRTLIDTQHITGLSAVIISRRSLIAIEKQLEGVSNLDGVCEKHYVKPLDDAGLDAIVNRCQGA